MADTDDRDNDSFGDLDKESNGPEQGENSAEGSSASSNEENEGKIERSKRKRRRADDHLEDDDYDLLEENLGVKFKRKKKFSRVKAAFDEEDSGEEGGRDALANHLFDADDSGDLVGKPVHSNFEDPNMYAPLSSSDEDVDDFIVDDRGEGVRRKKKGHRVYSSKELEEAQDVFGVDMDEFQNMLGDDDFEDGEDEDPDFGFGSGEEDLDEMTPRQRKKKSRVSTANKSIYDIFEPSELERKHFTDRDEVIRVEDIPERFQLRSHVVDRPNEETNELQLEAEWIYKYVFSEAPISEQVGGGNEAGSSFYGGGETEAAIYSIKPASAIPKIKQALHFMRNDSFEVPFIANYRKEYVEPELTARDLWKVYRWDERWCKFQTRKRNLLKLFVTMKRLQKSKIEENPDHLLPEGSRPLTQNDIDRLEGLQCLEELKDSYDHFCLYYGRELAELRRQRQKDHLDETLELNFTQISQSQTETPGKDATLKKIVRRDFYAICHQAGVAAVAEKFGLTPEQYGENLRDNYQRHETEQYPDDPETVAEDLVCRLFPDVESVLRGAVHMVAMQLAREPMVKQAVRQAFLEKARIAVAPTKKGKKEIDEGHDLSSVKYLKNKPLKSLKGDEFLRLAQGEKDNLIVISFSLDQTSSDSYGSNTSYLNEMKQLYFRDEFSLLVENWNKLRGDAVQKAYNDYLFPTGEKEIRTKLIMEARECIIVQCAEKLRHWISIAPYVSDYQVPEDEGEPGTSSKTAKAVTVLACSFEDDRDSPVYFAMLDGTGKMVDYAQLSCYVRRGRTFHKNDAKWKEEELKLLKEVLLKGRPHVVVIAAQSRDAFALKENMESCISEIETEAKLPAINVEVVDPELARVVQGSRRSKEEFPNFNPQLRLAVSLGRRLQDPLIEFTSLCSYDDAELLCLHLHPHQLMIPQDQLLPALMTEMIDHVNSVGVDVNRALEDEHYAHCVQFVCGLGRRKAAALLKLLRQKSMMLENRSQLVTRCAMGPKVFLNCAGFIKIDASMFADSSGAQEYAEILDSSRIHPETYGWARKMAIDALEYDESADETTPQSAVEEILESPDKLRDLDLDAFAEELERQGFGSKQTTLYEIRDELFAMYKEKRASYQSLTSEELFTILTGETEKSLSRGRLITCTVTGIVRRSPDAEALQSANPVKSDRTNLLQCPFCFQDTFSDLSSVWSHCDGGSCPGQPVGVRTRLDNGISGFISLKNLSDRQVKNPDDRVQQGMSVYCRVLRLNVEKYQVDLTSKSSDLAGGDEFQVEKDTYFNYDAAEADQIQKKKQMKKPPKSSFVKRMIAHPAFHNVSYKQAEEVMATMDVGECIVRPSSKGNDHLTVTWKVDESLYQHIDVEEREKENPYTIGNRLLIGDEEYEDIDEIIARHIQPIVSFAREIFSYKYYRHADGGKKAVLEQLLSAEKKKTPSRIPYLFSASRTLPGKFLLCYQPRSKPITEYVSVTPAGYRYRNQIHPSLPGLIQWFKEHFREPPPPPASKMPPPGYGGRSTVSQSVGGQTDGPPAFASAYSGVGRDLGQHHRRSGGVRARDNTQESYDGGWGANADTSAGDGWGASESQGGAGTSWGDADDQGAASSWGRSDDRVSERTGGWGASGAEDREIAGWGDSVESSAEKSWGGPPPQKRSLGDDRGGESGGGGGRRGWDRGGDSQERQSGGRGRGRGWGGGGRGGNRGGGGGGNRGGGGGGGGRGGRGRGQRRERGSRWGDQDNQSQNAGGWGAAKGSGWRDSSQKTQDKASRWGDDSGSGQSKGGGGSSWAPDEGSAWGSADAGQTGSSWGDQGKRKASGDSGWDGDAGRSSGADDAVSAWGNHGKRKERDTGGSSGWGAGNEGNAWGSADGAKNQSGTTAEGWGASSHAGKDWDAAW